MQSAKKRHAHMIDDPRRTEPLLRAVREKVRENSIVVDLGAGLGLLAIEAAKCGAKKIYAIDVDGEALTEAGQNAIDEGVAHRIEFIVGLSFDVELSERADLIICETVGSFAFDENILYTLKDAKERFLKEGGKIIPQKLELWGAPLSFLPKIEEPADIASIGEDDLAGPSINIASVDFSKSFSESIRIKAEFLCSKRCTIEAIAVWPKAFWNEDEITDASPIAKPTHWKQGILPMEPRDVQNGEKIQIEIIIEPHPDNPLMMTDRLWRWVE